MNEFVKLETIYEKLRGAYFWTPPATAASRRLMEKDFSIGPLEWKDGGHEYSAEINVRVSVNHVYVEKYFYKDSEKTTWTAIKNSIRRVYID